MKKWVFWIFAIVFVGLVNAQITRDIYPPCIRFATPSGSVVSPEFVFEAQVCDICPGAAEWTGINRARIRLHLFIAGISSDITEETSITPLSDCAGYMLRYAPSTPYSSGREIRFHIVAYDLAGNPAEADAEYVIRNATDRTPPCFSSWSPPDGATNVPVTTSLSVGICDVCPGTPGDYSGVNPDSIRMWIRIGDNPAHEIPREHIALAPIYCAGYVVTYTPMIEFPPSTRIRYSVRAVDFAGNVAEGSATFTTAPSSPHDTVDTYPPCVIWATDNYDTVPPDFVFEATVCDRCPDYPVISGINSESIRVYFLLPTGRIDVTSYCNIVPNEDCSGFSITYGRDEPYSPGTIIGFQIVARDLAGNATDPIHHYYVGYPPATDTEPPCILSWQPDPPFIPADSVAEGTTIGASICDICDSPITTPSGVNRESIVIEGFLRDRRMDLTRLATITPNECMGYNFTIPFYYIYLHFRPLVGDSLKICVSASDMEGNSTRECHTYIYGELVRDIYPPCIYGWRPSLGDTGISTATGIFVNVCDLCPHGAAPVASGIERENIRFTVRIGTGEFENVTHLVSFYELDCYGYTLEYHPMIEFPPATRIEACVRAVDNAGNVAEGCSHFFTEGYIIPRDTLPPIIELMPTAGETLRIDEAIVRASICDNPVGPPGVDPSSIEMIVVVNGREINVTDRLIIEPNRCFGYEVTLLPLDIYEPGVPVIVEIGASDYNRNRGYARTYFYIAPETHPVDTLRPCIVRFTPESGDTVPVNVTVFIRACDICGDFIDYPSSGILPDSVKLTLFANGISYNITYRAIITPTDAFCNGVDVEIPPLPDIYRPNMWITIGIRVADRNGNVAEASHRLYLFGETPPDTTDRFPPCIVEWHPNPVLDVTWPPDVEIYANVCDTCIPIGAGLVVPPSGVDLTTIRMRIRINDGEPIDVTEHLSIIENDCYGVLVSFSPWEGLFENGDYVRVILTGADRNGNRFEGVNSFAIWESGTDTLDTSPPCIVGWFPEDTGPVYIGREFGFESCDLCEYSVGYQSGVNLETIDLFTIIAPGETIHLSPTRVEPIRCLGYRVSYIPEPHILISDSILLLCARFADYAGNYTSGCHHWRIVPGIVDTTSPIVTNWWPERVISPSPTGELLGGFSSCDFPSTGEIPSGVDSSSIVVIMRSPELPSTIPLSFTLTRNRCMGYDVTFRVPREIVHSGMHIIVITELTDNAGNATRAEHNYVIEIPSIVDTIPPCIVETSPPDGARDVSVFTTIRAAICDICGETDIYTGINPESIELRLRINEGDWGIVPRELLSLEGLLCAGFAVTYYPMIEFPPNATISYCFTASDYARNTTERCATFRTAGGTPPRDTTPPMISGWWPERVISPSPTGELLGGFSTCDLPGTGETPSGVDSSSFVIVMRSDELPSPVRLPYTIERNRCWGYEVTFRIPTELVHDGMRIAVTVECSDFAGNSARGIYTYIIELPPIPIDTLSPCVVEWYPPDEIYRPVPELPLLGAKLCDICEDIIIEHPSGVNPLSLRAWIIVSTGYTIDITRFARFERVEECAGYIVRFVTPITVPIPVEPFELCLEFADFAGNTARECHRYNEGGIPPDTTDRTPPCVRGWIQEPGSTITPDAPIGAMICDLCDYSSVPQSGVDPSRLRLTIAYAGAVIDVTPYSEIIGIDCMGYTIIWSRHTPLPSGSSIEACVTAYDFAGNRTYQCVRYTVRPEFIDTIPPVIGDWVPPDSSTGVRLTDSIMATICGGVDSSTVRMVIYNPRGDSADVTRGVRFRRLLCDGYIISFNPSEFAWIPEFFMPGDWITVCVEAADYERRWSRECIHFRLAGFGPTARLISPAPGAYVSCEITPIRILLFDTDGVDSSTIEVAINDELYTISSPNIEINGDTLIIFVPREMFIDGRVYVGLLAASDIYGNPLENPIETMCNGDWGPPNNYYSYPNPGSVVPGIPEAIIVGLSDDGAGVCRELTYIIVNGNIYRAGSRGFHWGFAGGAGFMFYPREAGLVFSPGDTINICIHSADNVSFCMPNALDTCYSIYIMPPREHILTGIVRDGETAYPLSGVLVRAIPRFSGYGRVPISTDTTEADGLFELRVRDGAYIIEATPLTESGYMRQFFDHKPDPLTADVVRISSDMPDTIRGFNFDLLRAFARRYRVSGRVVEADPDDGPIERAFVIAISSTRERTTFTTTNEDGEYELYLAPGQYYLLAFHPGYIPKFYGCEHIWEPRCFIEIESDLEGIDFALQPIIRLVGGLFFGGRIIEADTTGGKIDIPVAGAEVFLIEPNTNEPICVSVTDQDGYFWFDNVDVGTYRLGASKPYYRYANLEPYLSLSSSRSDAVYRIWRYTEIPELYSHQIPTSLAINAYPNPFNTQLTLSFYLEKESHIVIEVYDIMGHLLQTLGKGTYKKGAYIALWDGKDKNGVNVPSGIYFVKLATENGNIIKKVMLIK